MVILGRRPGGPRPTIDNWTAFDRIILHVGGERFEPVHGSLTSIRWAYRGSAKPLADIGQMDEEFVRAFGRQARQSARLVFSAIAYQWLGENGNIQDIWGRRCGTQAKTHDLFIRQTLVGDGFPDPEVNEAMEPPCVIMTNGAQSMYFFV